MERSNLSEYATGELIWELVHRRGVLAVSGPESLDVRTAGPALALIFPGLTLRDEESEKGR